MAFDPRAYREAIRTVHVSYPVPFLVAAIFAFTGWVLGVAVLALPAFQSALIWLASVIAVAGLALVGYAVGLWPDLLRSERHEEIRRMIDIAGDKEAPQDVREGMLAAIAASTATPKRSKDDSGDDNG